MFDLSGRPTGGTAKAALSLAALFLLAPAAVSVRTAAAASLSVTWSSQDDFENNRVSIDGRTRTENIDTASSPGDVLLARTVTGGQLVGPNRVILPDSVPNSGGDIAANLHTGEYMIAWRDSRRGSPDIYVRRLGPDGVPRGETIIVCDNKKGKNSPSIAFDSRRSRYLVTWHELRSGNRIYGRLLNANGSPAGNEFPVAEGWSDQFNPDVAWNPAADEYLVAWQDRRSKTSFDIYAKRITGEGVPAGPEIAVSAAEGNRKEPAVAADDREGGFLILWSDARSGEADIYGRFIGREGKIEGKEFLVTDTIGPQLYPNLVFNGTDREFLAVWDDYRANVEPPEQLSLGRLLASRIVSPEQGVEIFGRRIGRDGSLLGGEIHVTEALFNQLRPALGYDPRSRSYLVVWQDGQRGTQNWDIRGRMIGADGTISGEELPLSIAPGSQFLPSLAYGQGTGEFIVAWKETHMGKGDRLSLAVQRVGEIPGAKGVLGGLIVDTSTEGAVVQGLYWNADLPAGTAVAVRSRSAGSREDLGGNEWSAPVTVSASPLAVAAERWLELEVILSTGESGVSPRLHSLTVRHEN